MPILDGLNDGKFKALPFDFVTISIPLLAFTGYSPKNKGASPLSHVIEYVAENIVLSYIFMIPVENWDLLIR